MFCGVAFCVWCIVAEVDAAVYLSTYKIREMFAHIMTVVCSRAPRETPGWKPWGRFQDIGDSNKSSALVEDMQVCFRMCMYVRICVYACIQGG